jgi:hypothetical protein
MPFRVTSVSRRVWWVTIIALGAAWFVTVLVSDLHGIRPVTGHPLGRMSAQPG